MDSDLLSNDGGELEPVFIATGAQVGGVFIAGNDAGGLVKGVASVIAWTGYSCRWRRRIGRRGFFAQINPQRVGIHTVNPLITIDPHTVITSRGGGVHDFFISGAPRCVLGHWLSAG